jgi:eukaryotic-like serine/threonine-protein kinase
MSSATTRGERNPVEGLADESAYRKRHGEPATAEDDAQAHPEPADDLLGLFPALMTMETLGGDASSHSSAITRVVESPAGGGATPGRLGEYRILREIGRGGMGVVYEAEQESLGRRVALKVLPGHLLADAKRLRRFQREARSAARLHHTNIVPVFGVGQHDGTHFYVMQFIEGQGLDVVLKELRQLRTARSHQAAGQGTLCQTPRGRVATDLARSLATGRFAAERDGDRPAGLGGGPTPSDVSPERPGPEPQPSESATPGPGTQSRISQLSETERSFAEGVARIGVQVADALAYAHAQGILHRDIKPSNLLLDRNGNVWVADFGVAKAVGADDLTHTGDIVGTVRYMAPERFEGAGDARADLYALGLSLYELLALRPAFPERDRANLIRTVTEADPPRLRKLNPKVPLDLETIVHKAMARDPVGRYATAGALAEDLRRFLEGRPILARRTSAPERCWRWCKRNPALAGLITGIALALVLGTAVSTSLAIRATANARRADNEARRANEEKRRGDQRLYVAEMGWAQQALRESQIDQVREHLQEAEPARPGDADFRGFEWYYLRRLCDATTRTLRGHTGAIYGLAFSPDGRRVVSAGNRDGTVKIWDVGSSRDGTVKIWDVGSGQLIRSLAGPTDGVICVAYSPDGRSIATGGGSDNAVRLWDAVSGALVRTLRGHSGRVGSVAFSPGGRRIASTGSDETIKVWETATGRELRTLRGHSKVINRVAYSPDGRTVASASPDGTVRLWDVDAGALFRTLDGHSTGAWGVAYSPDGRRVATSGHDKTVRIWDAASGQELLTLRGHADAVHTVAYSPDGRRLASSGRDGRVRLWDAGSGQPLQTFPGHAGVVHFVTFSPDGRCVASGGFDGTIKIWDILSDQEALTLPWHSRVVAAVAISRPDGRRVASAGLDQTVRLWDADTGREVRILRGHTGPIYGLAISPDGRRVASAGLDTSVRLWDAESGREVRTLRGHFGAIKGLAYSPDGRRLASAGLDKTVRLWDADDGRELKTLRGHTGGVIGLAYSPDGRHIASTGVDETVRLWDADTGNELRTLRGHSSVVTSVAFSPDGRHLASAGRIDGTVRIWDAESGVEIRALRGNAVTVSDVAYSPDGRRIAGAGAGTVRLWNADTGQLVFTLSHPVSTARGVAFSPDGLRLAAAVGEAVKLWDATPLTPESRTNREAAELVEFLFGQRLPTTEVLDRIQDNPTLDPDVRRRALDLAGPYGASLLDHEAERVVNALYETLLRPAVRARLLADKTLSEPVRRRALALAEQIPESAFVLNGVSWSVVSRPGAAPEAYRLALEQAETACRLEPDNGAGLNTLGVAQYRAGQYREAVATLTESDRINSEGELGSQASDLAFRALAHHRLGEQDRAHADLGRLRALMRKPAHASVSEVRSFLREAEAIELDLAFPSDPFTR